MTDRRLGRYEVGRSLGRGGMAEVFEAVLCGPEGFRKPVALKLLKEGPQRLDRRALVHEARIGALLQHPNVVSVFELGCVDDVWFVAMELVRGSTLSDRIRRGGLPPVMLLDVGSQAAAGLGAIHDLHVDGRGIVHRDVKPSNLLLDTTGLLKVADLGVAAWAGGPAGAAGTPGFMAPEQARGEALDARADVYALGATLYVAATARRPFTGRPTNDAEQVAQLASSAFLAPADAVVSGLGDLLASCMAPDPARRPASMRAFAQALAALHGSLGRASTGTPATDPTVPTTRSDSELPTVRLRLGNVPPPRDRLFGREREGAALEALVQRERLVTLLGLGGAGKTRLALQTGHNRQLQEPGGVWFVDLSEARTQEGVCLAVARALGVVLDRSALVQQIGDALAGRPACLLILDNVEQVVAPVADAVRSWLDRATEVRILTTSRVPTGLPEERRMPVGALATEDGIALFCDRAQRSPTDMDRPTLTLLVEALEGHPLAIELAAGRSRVLPLTALVSRLNDRLRLLAGGGRERPERHRSLTASLEGSWELLSAAAQRGLAALSVFEGGLTLEAAEAVVPPDDTTTALDVVQQLVDAGLVRADPRSGRLSSMVVVSTFASERLEGRARTDAETRHGRWYAQLGNAAGLAALDRHGGGKRLQDLLPELDNVVVACRRAVARGDGEVAVGTALAAQGLLSHHASLSVARDLLVAALAVAPAGLRLRVRLALAASKVQTAETIGLSEELAELVAAARAGNDAALQFGALDAMGSVAWLEGRAVDARALHTEAHALAGSCGLQAEMARSLGNLGVLAGGLGDLVEAGGHFEAALALHRSLGNARGEAVGLGNLGIVHMNLGRAKQANDAYQAALSLHRAMGDRRGEANVLLNVGNFLSRQGRPEEAWPCYAEAGAVHRAMGNRMRLVTVLLNEGTLHAKAGRTDAAYRVYGEALQIAEASGDLHKHGACLRGLGLIELERGGPDADRRLVEAERVLASGGFRLELFELYCGRAGIEGRQARTEQASATLEQAERLLVELGAGPDSPLRQAYDQVRRGLLPAPP